MTKQLEIGDILVIGQNDGIDSRRLVYTGGDKATLEMFYDERSRAGGPTNSGKGEWKAAKADVALSAEQIAFWLTKKI